MRLSYIIYDDGVRINTIVLFCIANANNVEISCTGVGAW